jgi:hypothetical protein
MKYLPHPVPVVEVVFLREVSQEVSKRFLKRFPREGSCCGVGVAPKHSHHIVAESDAKVLMMMALFRTNNDMPTMISVLIFLSSVCLGALI